MISSSVERDTEVDNDTKINQDVKAKHNIPIALENLKKDSDL